MADISQAVQFVLHQEDARLSGDITKLDGDRGGLTRYGIAANAHPDLVAKGFFELVDGQPKIANEEALTMAELVYEQEYADPLSLGQITDQDVADRILSFAVNEGMRQAIVLLQRALNFCKCEVTEDGIFGPATLRAINAVQPAQLLSALRSYQAGFYRHLVSVRPALLPYLNGFLNRANA